LPVYIAIDILCGPKAMPGHFLAQKFRPTAVPSSDVERALAVPQPTSTLVSERVLAGAERIRVVSTIYKAQRIFANATTLPIKVMPDSAHIPKFMVFRVLAPVPGKVAAKSPLLRRKFASMTAVEVLRLGLVPKLMALIASPACPSPD
jgi:hypothetical protein